MDDRFLLPKDAGAPAVPVTGTRFANADALTWRKIGVPGFSVKPLCVVGNGQTTSLMKIEPGAGSEPHARETFGRDNMYWSGNFIPHVPRATHTASSETGALVLVSAFSN